ncbi:MAG: ion channel [Rikenellaceae bacterium]
MKHRVGDFFNILVLIGSLVITAMISVEILYPDLAVKLLYFNTLQLVICLIFIADFFVRLTSADKKMRYIFRNVFFLIISIPFLNIFQYYGVDITTNTHHLLRIVLLLRGGYGLMLVVRYLTRKAISNLLYSYLITMLAITYFSSLFFFDVEKDINSGLHTFGDALYWAIMQVAAEGSDINPVTNLGRVLNVLLSILGVCLIPVGAAYIMSIYNKKSKVQKK